MLVLENGLVPPTVHLKTPNPAIPFDEWNLRVPTSLTPFPSPAKGGSTGLRRIGVNSFGYGGTNAHVIVDDAASYLESHGITQGLHFTKTPAGGLALKAPGQHQDAAATSREGARLYVFPFSSHDRDGLRRIRNALALYMTTSSLGSAPEEQQANFLRDLAFTLAERRSRLQWKTHVLASSSCVQDVVQALQQQEAAQERLSSRGPKLGFVFTGQGVQWPGMGAKLLEAYPVFQASVEAADAFLQRDLGCAWSALQELGQPRGKASLSLAEYAQPLCTILQVALVDLLRDWGVHPRAVVGHSAGEIAAAYCTGVLSREEAWKMAYLTGASCASLKEDLGPASMAMMALGLGVKAAWAMISRAGLDEDEKDEAICVACINSPSSVTLSGDAVAVKKMLELAEREGVSAKRLDMTDVAYHSPHHIRLVAHEYIESVGEALDNNITHTNSHATRISMFSSVTGTRLEEAEGDLRCPAYWTRNLISAVQFCPAIREMVRKRSALTAPGGEDDSIDLLVEIGPHDSLRTPSLQSLEAIGGGNLPYFSVLSRHKSDVNCALELAGTLFSHGVNVDLLSVDKLRNSSKPLRPLVDLPSYPWNHSQSYWAESRLARGFRLRDFGARSLLGAPLPLTMPEEHAWRGFLQIRDEEWVADHRIQGSVLYPAAGFIAMAIEGARQLALLDCDHEKPGLGSKTASTTKRVTGFRLRDVQFVAAMIVPEEGRRGAVEHLLNMRRRSPDDPEGWWLFTVASCAGGDQSSLTKNCTGLIRVEYDHVDDVDEEYWARAYLDARTSCGDAIAPDVFYNSLREVGFEYGPSFANLVSLHVKPRKPQGHGQATGKIRMPDVGLDKSLVLPAGVHDDNNAGILYSLRPHIIHPALMDTSIHLCFAALMDDRAEHGKSTMANAMVPILIDEVYASTSLPTGPPGRQLPAFCSGVGRAGLKNLVAGETAVMDDSGRRAVFSIRNLCCSELAGAAASSQLAGVTARIPKKCASKTVWRPRWELLSAEELKMWIGQSVAGDKSVGRILAEYLSLRHHATPDLQVREFVLGGQACLVQSMDREKLASMLKTGLQYDVVVWTEEAGLEAKSGLGDLDDLVQVRMVNDLSGAPADSAIVILVAGAGLSEEDTQKACDMISGHLSDDGRLVCVTTCDDQSPGPESPGRCAPVLGLQYSPGKVEFHREVDFLTTSGNVRVMTTRKSNQNEFITWQDHGQENGVEQGNEGKREEVVLLVNSEASSPSQLTSSAQFLSALTTSLQSAALSPSVQPWDGYVAASHALPLAGKTILSLLELDKPFWGTLATSGAEGARDFEAAKQLLLSAGSMLWVAGTFRPGGQSQAAAEMVHGIARVLRNEVPGIHFHTLQIDDGLESDPGAAGRRVARTFLSACHGGLGGESEFRIRSGTVQVSRLVVDDEVNEEMDVLNNVGVDVTARPIEMAPLEAFASKRLRLEVGQVGRPDSLHFVEEAGPSPEDSPDDSPDDSDAADYGDNEVEISIKASRLTRADLATFNGQSLSSARLLGTDAAGVVTRVLHKGESRFKPGDRVMVVCAGSHRTVARARESMVGHIPPSMSLELAARLPSAAAAAWYALVHVAGLDRKLVKGPKKMLVHDATSVLGQLVSWMATCLGAEVVTWQGTTRTRREPRRAVDVAIDCSGHLAGRPLQQTLDAVVPFGHFLRVRWAAETPFTSSSASVMHHHADHASSNVAISSIDLASLLDGTRPEMPAQILQAALQFILDHHEPRAAHAGAGHGQSTATSTATVLVEPPRQPHCRGLPAAPEPPRTRGHDHHLRCLR